MPGFGGDFWEVNKAPLQKKIVFRVCIEARGLAICRPGCVGQGRDCAGFSGQRELTKNQQNLNISVDFCNFFGGFLQVFRGICKRFLGDVWELFLLGFAIFLNIFWNAFEILLEVFF